ncbi:hydroxyacid dehydrogenase [Rhizobium lentis]|uniref:hydroxyacid dehydrogenase n=1 Tax=Rhizobium lentis TaxID=1138194 RepID=UPI001C8285D2|nr:hydroxyacid dehydrogenase [Rhizobium lentis]MBX5048491.1 hydroxyacid dehydrogenase [Rhizobium lentis]MBX5060594.1 hydroxyacid dehydrogenase [Rhizobium lentis]
MSEHAPVIAALLTERTRRMMLDDAAIAQLNGLGSVRWPAGATLDAAEVDRLLQGATACLTGWGTPPFDPAARQRHPQLALVAHSAGSVRTLVPATLFDEGLRVSHAASKIAASVAEFVVAEALLAMRGIHRLHHALRGGGEWLDVRTAVPQRLLGARTVGIVGAGYVGRAVIRLLVPFGCRVLVVDPYLDDREADALGVVNARLGDALAWSDVISLHAPVLPETRRMIGARELALLRPGTLFINTARAELVDEAALLAEIRSGRIEAALDVFDHEPLPPDSPFRDPALANVTISPHAAGHTEEAHLAQGRAMVDEIGRLLRREPLHHEVSRAMLDRMA